MRTPTTNPFESAYEQILTAVTELTDAAIMAIITNHCGEDAEVKAIGRGGRQGWVRVNCWQEEITDFADCWIWICNDTVEWSMVAQS